MARGRALLPRETGDARKLAPTAIVLNLVTLVKASPFFPFIDSFAVYDLLVSASLIFCAILYFCLKDERKEEFLHGKFQTPGDCVCGKFQ